MHHAAETLINALRAISRRLPPWLGRTLVVVGLAYALSAVLIKPFSFSLSAVMATPKDDFCVTDMYQMVADRRAVHTLSPDIVIVDINNATRAEIAEALELIGLCDPKAVGLDIMFEERRPDDEALVQSIELAEHLVAVRLLGDPSSRDAAPAQRRFTRGRGSWFEPITGSQVVYAAANYPSAEPGATIREFRPQFPMESGDTTPSFALAMARIIAPGRAAELEARGRVHERIYYPSTEFAVYHPRDLYEHAEELTGKTVIVGSLGDPGDLHRTPLDPRMPGTLIQAHALNTILHGPYLTAAPAWTDPAIAFAVTFLLVALLLSLAGEFKGMTVRVVQMVMLVAVVYVGYRFFLDHGVLVDFSRSFLMLAFAMFAVDVWLGLKGLWKIIVRHYHKRHRQPGSHNPAPARA